MCANKRQKGVKYGTSNPHISANKASGKENASCCLLQSLNELGRSA